MIRRMPLVLISLFVLASASAQTVTVSVTSTQDGQSVAPGATIDWQIVFSVSNGDNVGLALLISDLQQNAANPELIDLPPAAGVPAPMSNFSRPAGISNPGETDPTTGYIGVQRGTPGELNLVQIGGAQNVFGQALPGGAGVAENATVVAGVGQAGQEVLASGSFTAPATCGTYVLEILNTEANTLVAVLAPPANSPVTQAAVTVAAASITVTVALTGDTDGDNDVDLGDLAVVLSAFGTSFGDPGFNPAADFNQDAVVDLSDLALILSNFGKVCV